MAPPDDLIMTSRWNHFTLHLIVCSSVAHNKILRSRRHFEGTDWELHLITRPSRNTTTSKSMESKLEYRDLALGTCCYPKSISIIKYLRGIGCFRLKLSYSYLPSTEVSRELTLISNSLVAKLVGLPSLRFTTSASGFRLHALCIQGPFHV